jgi:hypothetical protein
MNTAFTSEGRSITNSINTNYSFAADAVAYIGTATVAITFSIGPVEALSLRFVVIYNNGSTFAASNSNGTAAIAAAGVYTIAAASTRSIAADTDWSIGADNACSIGPSAAVDCTIVTATVGSISAATA